MKTVALIGCGAIGSLIADAIEKRIIICDRLILYDSDQSKAEKLRRSATVFTAIVKSIEEMISQKPTVIVEAASQEAARQYVPKILDSNVDVIVMSVGALLDMNVRSRRIHTSSGAIGGLDAIVSADLAGIESVLLTTRKNPRVLDVKDPENKIVFQGTPEEAVKRYPTEMNVAATLALAVGSGKVRVQVVSDPKTNRNMHEIRVRWKYGEMLFQFSNDPHPQNPKTSALAAWSAIRLLQDLLVELSNT